MNIPEKKQKNPGLIEENASTEMSIPEKKQKNPGLVEDNAPDANEVSEDSDQNKDTQEGESSENIPSDTIRTEDKSEKLDDGLNKAEPLVKEKQKSFLKKDAVDEKDPEFEQAYKDFKVFCDEEQDILDDIKAAEDSTALIQIKKKFIDSTNRLKTNNLPEEPKSDLKIPKKPLTPTESTKPDSSPQLANINPIDLPIKLENKDELQKKVLNFVKQANLK